MPKLNPFNNMKNLLFTLIFTCLSTLAVAQFHLGISAGPNLSFWTWEIKPIAQNLDYQPALGWRGVLLGEWQIKPMLGIRVELGAQLKANKMIKNFIFPSDILAGDLDGNPGSYREYFQNWEESLLLQISPIKKYRQVYILTGCTASQMDKAWNRSSGTEAGKKFRNKNTIDINDGNWNRNGLAAEIGVGGNFPLGANSSLKVEGRFQYALTELAANENVDAYAHSLLFQVGYLHRL